MKEHKFAIFNARTGKILKTLTRLEDFDVSDPSKGPCSGKEFGLDCPSVWVDHLSLDPCIIGWYKDVPILAHGACGASGRIPRYLQIEGTVPAKAMHAYLRIAAPGQWIEAHRIGMRDIQKASSQSLRSTKTKPPRVYVDEIRITLSHLKTLAWPLGREPSAVLRFWRSSSTKPTLG